MKPNFVFVAAMATRRAARICRGRNAVGSIAFAIDQDVPPDTLVPSPL